MKKIPPRFKIFYKLCLSCNAINNWRDIRCNVCKSIRLVEKQDGINRIIPPRSNVKFWKKIYKKYNIKSRYYHYCPGQHIVVPVYELEKKK
jgi:ribosomal protein L40E